MRKALKAREAAGGNNKDRPGVRRGSALDWAVAIGVAVLLAVALRFFWTRYPHPAETGTLLLGLGAMAAAGVAFGKRREGRPLAWRAVTFATIVAVAQAAIQLASAKLVF